MTRELIITPEAECDIEEAACWINTKVPGLGQDFLERIDKCLQ